MKADYSWKRSAQEYAGLYSFITGISITEPEKKPLTEEILDLGKDKGKKTSKAKKPAAKKKVAEEKMEKAKTSVVKKPRATKSVKKEEPKEEKKES